MTLYTDHDPRVCAWLEQLIRGEHLPDGRVVCCDVCALDPALLEGFEHVHFFAGIGGWALAFLWAGWTGEAWSASLPCQPFSSSGKRKGFTDDRHLWPWFRELVRERRPSVVFGEQVASPLGRSWFAGVRADLETLGYRVGAADLCAAGVGSPHIRQRIFWVAYSELSRPSRFREHGGASAVESSDVLSVARGGGSGGLAYSRHDDGSARSARSFDESESSECKGAGSCGTVGRLGNSERDGLEGEFQAGTAGGPVVRTRTVCGWSDSSLIPCADGKTRRIEPGLVPLADGVSARVVRLRGYGNAIVPQVAAAFIVAAREAMKDLSALGVPKEGGSDGSL